MTNTQGDHLPEGTLSEDHPTMTSPAPLQEERIAISSLMAGDSPRQEEDEEHVHRLLQIESKLPPILVHRHTMRVIDGMHRLTAAILKGQNEINVRYFDGSEQDAFIQAVRENMAHGLPLSLADRKAAANRIIESHPNLSDRSIATVTGLSAKTVKALRRDTVAKSPKPSSRVGADGRLRPLDITEGRRRAAQVIFENPQTSIREVARIAGVSVGTAHDVRVRIRRGQQPYPTRFHTARREPEPEPSTAVMGTAGESGSHRPGRRVGRANASELPLLLQKLTRDPALRQSELGRELLRIMHTQLMAISDWPSILDSVPPHCAATVAKIARLSADCWHELALEIERREDDGL